MREGINFQVWRCGKKLKPFMNNPISAKASTIIPPLLFFIVMSLLYCFATPLWVPPDEDRHYVYCEYIAQNKKLPYLNPQEEGNKVAQAIHPPLYYILAAFFCRDTSAVLQDNLIVDESPGYRIVKINPAAEPADSSTVTRNAYLLRLLSIFFSVVTIYCTYLLVLVIFPGEYITALTAAFFVATNPQFIHISTSVSNEPMSSAFSALYLLIIIVFSRKQFGFKQQIFSGLILGLGLLIKTSILIYIPVTFFLLCATFRKNLIEALKKFSLIIVVAVGVSSWWYLRNLVAYGDPVFSQALNEMQPWSLRAMPISLEYILLFLKMSFMSFFGFFGAMQVPLSGTHFGLYGIIIALSGFGFIVCWFRNNFTLEQVQTLSTLVCAFVCGLILYLSFNVTYTMFMGRYLYVVIVPVAICFSVGLRRVFPTRWRTFFMLITSFLLVIISGDVYSRIVNPSFADSGLHVGIEQKEFCCFTPPLSNTFSIQQSFVSNQDNLCAVRAMFAQSSQLIKGSIRFALYAEDALKPIAQINLPVNQIDDFSKFLFAFQPIANSSGKRFSFTFDVPELEAHQYPALTYNRETAGDAFLYFNNQKQNGSLFFSTFHLPGAAAPNKWLGGKAHFMDEGWYVSLRELQLYGEFSKESMLWKQTRNKILRMRESRQSHDTR